MNMGGGMGGNVSASAAFVNVQGPGVSVSAAAVSVNVGGGGGGCGVGMMPCGLPMGIPVVGGIPIGRPRTMLGGIPMIPVGQPMMPCMMGGGMPVFAGAGYPPQFGFMMAQAQLAGAIGLMSGGVGVGAGASVGVGGPFPPGVFPPGVFPPGVFPPGMFPSPQRQQAVTDLQSQFNNTPVNPTRLQAILNRVPADQRAEVLKEALGVTSNDPQALIEALRDQMMDGQNTPEAKGRAGKAFFGILGDLAKSGAISNEDLTREVARARSQPAGDPWRVAADRNEAYLDRLLRNNADSASTRGTDYPRTRATDMPARKTAIENAIGAAGNLTAAQATDLAAVLDAMKDDNMPEGQKIRLLKDALEKRGIDTSGMNNGQVRQQFLSLILDKTDNWNDARTIIQAYRRAFSNDSPRQMQRDLNYLSRAYAAGPDRDRANEIIAEEP